MQKQDRQAQSDENDQCCGQELAVVKDEGPVPGCQQAGNQGDGMGKKVAGYAVNQDADKRAQHGLKQENAQMVEADSFEQGE